MKKCKQCGKTLNRRQKKYCSSKCQGLGSRKRNAKKCLICNKIIIITPSRSKTKYCSKECANIAKIGKPSWNKNIYYSCSSHFKKGHIPWNKGRIGVYSKETLREMSRIKKGITFKEKYGIKRALALRKKLSESHKGIPSWNKGKKFKPHTKKWKMERSKALKGVSYEKRFGKRRAQEIKKKISKSKIGNTVWKGRKHTAETIKKMHIVQSGKIISFKQRKKISIAHTGKHLSEEHKKKIGEKVSGEKHPFWLGGISREPYSLEWTNKLKRQIAERDRHTCQYCGMNTYNKKRGGCPHHISYIKKDCRLINLVWVCHACNIKFNANRDYWFAFWCYNKGIESAELVI